MHEQITFLICLIAIVSRSSYTRLPVPSWLLRFYWQKTFNGLSWEAGHLNLEVRQGNAVQGLHILNGFTDFNQSDVKSIE